MGAVHGVAYKYVAIAAAASYGAYLSQPHSYARLGLGLVGATNSIIVVLTDLNRRFHKDRSLGRGLDSPVIGHVMPEPLRGRGRGRGFLASSSI